MNDKSWLNSEWISRIAHNLKIWGTHQIYQTPYKIRNLVVFAPVALNCKSQVSETLSWADTTLCPQQFNLDLIRRLEQHLEWSGADPLFYVSTAIWFHLRTGKFIGHFTIPMLLSDYFTTQDALKELTPSQSKALMWNRTSTIWMKKYSKKQGYPPPTPHSVDPSLVELNP